MVVLISAPGGQAAGCREGRRRGVCEASYLQKFNSLHPKLSILIVTVYALIHTDAALTTCLTKCSSDPAGTCVYSSPNLPAHFH